MKVYRIFPGIGIARLGKSANDFFISPEIPGLGPLELMPDGSVVPVTKYKDQNHRIRRQGARFRIYELEQDGAGATTSFKEITAADAQIEWTVELANEKAAAGRFISEARPEATAARNPGVSTDQLVIKPSFPSISGANQQVLPSTVGRFKQRDVSLGELRTDEKGRLIVLGGQGFSSSVPDDLPLGEGTVAFPGHTPNNFANNEGWHDDVADGPVSATLRFPSQAPIQIQDAWVIVAPPDYSPATLGVTTLYDIALQASIENGWFTAPQPPSFKRDVLPILKATTDLRWVSMLQVWERISRDWRKLADKTIDVPRQEAFELLMSVEAGALANFRFTDTQRQVLTHWSEGDFIDDLATPDPPSSLDPNGIDRASLSQTVGGGFYPGIEAGVLLTYKELYSSPFRITRAPFTSHGRQLTPHAGFVTRNMACPWQADFLKCASQTDTSIWWPAQRPIDVFVMRTNGPARMDWDGGIGNHQDLVKRHDALGFILRETQPNGEVLFLEKERDPGLPR